MNEKIVVTYDGVEVEYLEFSNRWRFELRGRERSAESLAKAKEAIDKPDPKTKTKFQPIAGWLYRTYGENGPWAAVTVTSVADNYGYSGDYVWVSNNGSRSKEPARTVYVASEANDDRRHSIDILDARIKNLQGDRERIFRELERVDLSGVE